MINCPLCKEPLNISPKSASCINHHSFDRAKEGYFNLLPVQYKNTLNPGDDEEMLKARAHFLEQGFYQEFKTTLCGLIKASKAETLLDQGCGEGYYTQSFADLVKSSYAFDISKFAVKKSAKSCPKTNCFVASSFAIPILTESVDLVTCLFTPLDETETARILKTNGHLLLAAPGQQHLKQLREHLYENILEHDDDKWLNRLNHFHLVDQVRITGKFNLSKSEDISALVKMTPHYWRASRHKRQELLELSQLEMSYDFVIYHFQKNNILLG